MLRGILIGVGVSLGLLVAADTRAQSSQDEQAIHQLAQQYETGWNTHDMTLLGSMRTDDIDFVVVTGEHRKGREQSMGQIAEQHNAVQRQRVDQ